MKETQKLLDDGTRLTGSRLFIPHSNKCAVASTVLKCRMCYRETVGLPASI